jgi:uncharacterized protein (TIGR00730 family)
MTERSVTTNCTENVIVTGGGPGVMEAGNLGAAEAGGCSIGLNIVLPHEQVPNEYVTPDLCFNFHYFGIRKMHFLLRAKAIAVFPGGFGTLDELFESLTLIQTGRMEQVPVILFGEKFWREIVNWEGLAEAGTISDDDLQLFRFVETAEEAVAPSTVGRAPARSAPGADRRHPVRSALRAPGQSASIFAGVSARRSSGNSRVSPASCTKTATGCLPPVTIAPPARARGVMRVSTTAATRAAPTRRGPSSAKLIAPARRRARRTGAQAAASAPGSG